MAIGGIENLAKMIGRRMMNKNSILYSKRNISNYVTIVPHISGHLFADNKLLERFTTQPISYLGSIIIAMHEFDSRQGI